MIFRATWSLPQESKCRGAVLPNCGKLVTFNLFLSLICPSVGSDDTLIITVLNLIEKFTDSTSSWHRSPDNSHY